MTKTIALEEFIRSCAQGAEECSKACLPERTSPEEIERLHRIGHNSIAGWETWKNEFLDWVEDGDRIFKYTDFPCVDCGTSGFVIARQMVGVWYVLYRLVITES